MIKYLLITLCLLTVGCQKKGDESIQKTVPVETVSNQTRSGTDLPETRKNNDSAAMNSTTTESGNTEIMDDSRSGGVIAESLEDIAAESVAVQPEGESGRILLGSSSRPSAEKESEAPEENKLKPEIVAASVEELIFDGGTMTVAPEDFDIGVLPLESGDSRYELASKMLNAMIEDKALEAYFHSEYSVILQEIVFALRNEGKYIDYRIGEMKSHQDGYYIPIRLFEESRSGVGHLFLSLDKDDWVVQDIIFDAGNMSDGETEPFAPSLYRWMEVF